MTTQTPIFPLRRETASAKIRKYFSKYEMQKIVLPANAAFASWRVSIIRIPRFSQATNIGDI